MPIVILNTPPDVFKRFSQKLIYKHQIATALKHLYASSHTGSKLEKPVINFEKHRLKTQFSQTLLYKRLHPKITPNYTPPNKQVFKLPKWKWILKSSKKYQNTIISEPPPDIFHHFANHLNRTLLWHRSQSLLYKIEIRTNFCHFDIILKLVYKIIWILWFHVEKYNVFRTPRMPCILCIYIYTQNQQKYQFLEEKMPFDLVNNGTSAQCTNMLIC